MTGTLITARRPALTLALVCAALLVVVVDVTVLHVAAPTIAIELGTTPAELLWIVDAYPLVVAPLLLVTGVLGDRIGHRRMLIGGLLGFAVFSLAAAAATTPLLLIGSRAVLGVAAAMVMPATMALLRHAYPDRVARLRAVGIWSAVSAGGAAAGPLLGGALVETTGWSAVFLVNVPYCLVVAGVALRVLPRDRTRPGLRIDAVSALLSITAVLALVFTIKHAAHDGLDVITAGVGLIAVGSCWWFIRRQGRLARRGAPQLLRLALFRSAPFSVAVAVVLLAMFAIVGLELLLAQYLQLVLGLSPLEAALRLAAISAATLVGALCAAAVTRRLGARRATTVALGLATLALLPLLTLGDAERLLLTVGCLGVVGFCLEIAFVAANDTIVSSVPAEDAGQAAGIEETAYDLGGGLGIAVLGSVAATIYTASFSTAGLSDHEADVSRESLTAAHELAAASTGATGPAIAEAANTAFLAGMHGAVVVAVVATAGIALLAASAGTHSRRALKRTRVADWLPGRR